MAKFLYRMQNILNIKYKLEDTAKQNFADALLALRTEEEKQETLVKRRDAYAAEYEQMLVGKLDFLTMEQCANAVDIMNEKIMEQDDVIRAKSKELEQARQKLNQVIQERKMHETLKEKQFEVFQKELSMQEVKEIDEVVSYQYGPGKANAEE